MSYVLRPVDMNKCIGCFTCMLVCSAVNHSDHSTAKSAIVVRTIGGMTTSYIATVCRSCAEPECREVCPADALEPRPGGGVLVNADKCFGCRKCVAACSVRAVKFDKETQKPIICHHCGVCATFCPHECLLMEEVEEVTGNAQ
ncbi:MAG: 4Fe-4S binding protein [Oscillospiraceae bacterium]|nr:4Fe-4S binding protein [Oscillospiraceae bacterium]